MYSHAGGVSGAAGSALGSSSMGATTAGSMGGAPAVLSDPATSFPFNAGTAGPTGPPQTASSQPLTDAVSPASSLATGNERKGADADKHSATLTAPSGNGLTGLTGNAGASYDHGPGGICYLKLLVSNVVAGSIIGQKGSTISHIGSSTGCTVRLSHTSCYFPGTNDRVVVMWGKLWELRAAFSMVFEKIRGAPASDTAINARSGGNMDGRTLVKIVVPNSAVSQLIGKQGQAIKELQEMTETKIQISNRDEHQYKERVVSITGAPDNVSQAALRVLESIQSDPHIKDHTVREINYVSATTATPLLPHQISHHQHGGPPPPSAAALLGASAVGCYFPQGAASGLSPALMLGGGGAPPPPPPLHHRHATPAVAHHVADPSCLYGHTTQPPLPLLAPTGGAGVTHLRGNTGNGGASRARHAGGTPATSPMGGDIISPFVAQQMAGVAAPNNHIGTTPRCFMPSLYPTPTSGGPAMSPLLDYTLEVPDAYVGFLIGKQGTTLQAIQQQAGVRIRISGKGEFVPGTENRRLTMSGHAAGIHFAGALLQHKLYEIEEILRHRNQSYGSNSPLPSNGSVPPQLMAPISGNSTTTGQAGTAVVHKLAAPLQSSNSSHTAAGFDARSALSMSLLGRSGGNAPNPMGSIPGSGDASTAVAAPTPVAFGTNTANNSNNNSGTASSPTGAPNPTSSQSIFFGNPLEFQRPAMTASTTHGAYPNFTLDR